MNAGRIWIRKMTVGIMWGWLVVLIAVIPLTAFIESDSLGAATSSTSAPTSILGGYIVPLDSHGDDDCENCHG